MANGKYFFIHQGAREIYFRLIFLRSYKNKRGFLDNNLVIAQRY
jgi:hypothetical protein